MYKEEIKEFNIYKEKNTYYASIVCTVENDMEIVEYRFPKVVLKRPETNMIIKHKPIEEYGYRFYNQKLEQFVNFGFGDLLVNNGHTEEIIKDKRIRRKNNENNEESF